MTRRPEKSSPNKPYGKKPTWNRAPSGRQNHPQDKLYLYGLHTVACAIDNPAREIKRLLVTKNALPRLESLCDDLRCQPELVDPRRIDEITGRDAVHQGVLLETSPLPETPLESLADASLVLILDQITDPHNVGAILRSATAFKADAVIVTRRHSPAESGVLAKSASGALDTIPMLTARNLSNAISELNGLGFQTLGLDSEGERPLEQAIDIKRPIALVLGSEGKGLRQKTRETCTEMCRLDMPGPIASLNVSNATALALYAVDRLKSGLLATV